MTRKIRNDCPAVVEAITVGDISDVKDWLQTQAAEHQLKWMLAHADDGVIWGKVDENGQLVTSDSVALGVSPPLRSDTLQQARLFSEDAELLLWRDGDNKWHARLVRKPSDREAPTFAEAIDEPQMLWGTHGEHCPNDFTLLRDGAQGLRHAVPQKLPLGANNETTPPRLIVRHYLNKDGFARIIASRLVGLRMEGQE